MRTGRRLLPLLLTVVLLGTLLLTGAATPGFYRTAEDCAAASRDAVVYVRAYGKSGSLKSTGSGFLISADGKLITAAHVVAEAERISVILADGEELEARLLYCDSETDAASLRLPEKPGAGYSYIPVSRETPVMGARLRAMGYPQKDTVIFTEGLVSAESAVISGKNRMLVTCQIVNGMSGGPIMNERGEAVGIVSGSILTMSGIHLSVLPEDLHTAAIAANMYEGAEDIEIEETGTESGT